MGVSEGCYCFLSQNQNSQSMMALNPQSQPHPKKQKQEPLQQLPSQSQPLPGSSGEKKYEDQLKSLTNQLSKIHLDTQAQLSSLHSILNERLKDPGDEPDHGFNESQLKDWVKQYRRFRKGNKFKIKSLLY